MLPAVDLQVMGMSASHATHSPGAIHPASLSAMREPVDADTEARRGAALSCVIERTATAFMQS